MLCYKHIRCSKNVDRLQQRRPEPRALHDAALLKGARWLVVADTPSILPQISGQQYHAV